MTGYCTTWSGEGDATSGTRQAATEIDFHTDIDEDGEELVSARQHVPSHGQGLHCIILAPGMTACRTPGPQWGGYLHVIVAAHFQKSEGTLPSLAALTASLGPLSSQPWHSSTPIAGALTPLLPNHFCS